MKIEFPSKSFSKLKSGDAFMITPNNTKDIYMKLCGTMVAECGVRVNSVSLGTGCSKYICDDTVVYPIQCTIVRWEDVER